MLENDFSMLEMTAYRLGPITVLCYLNSWIIVGLLRLSKNRQVGNFAIKIF
jgi:hypothetical protein